MQVKAYILLQLDYSFLNLETGVFAQLYEEQYLSFANNTFNGSIPAEGPDETEVLFPTYVALSTMNSPSSKSPLNASPRHLP